jgi:ligand-binding sensor domain-containing protein
METLAQIVWLMLWIFSFYPHGQLFNPHYFSTFTKLQQLQSNLFNSLLKDYAGNILGSKNGGWSKSDWKSFHPYSKNEGPLNKDVWTMVEDKFGLLWFCTKGGRVNRYPCGIQGN